jgi:hypothetical protein
MGVRREANQQFAATEIEHRPLDHRRLRQHQRNCFSSVESVLILVRQFAECRAGAIEQGLPAELLAPRFKLRALDAGGLVIVKGIIDAVLVEPSARLFHRVAVLDAVDGDRHRFPERQLAKV